MTDGATAQQRISHDSREVVQDTHAHYQEARYRQNVFSLSLATAASITADTGPAGGTPALYL